MTKRVSAALAASSFALIAAVIGCGGGGSAGILDNQTIRVSPSGSNASVFGGRLRLNVPAGSAPTRQTVVVIENPDASTDNRIVSGTMFTLSPGDYAFTGGATLTIRYAGSIPGGNSEESLALYRLDEGVWTPLDLSQVNTDQNTVSARIDRLGTFAILTTGSVGTNGGATGGDTGGDTTGTTNGSTTGVTTGTTDGGTTGVTTGTTDGGTTGVTTGTTDGGTTGTTDGTTDGGTTGVTTGTTLGTTTGGTTGFTTTTGV